MMSVDFTCPLIESTKIIVVEMSARGAWLEGRGVLLGGGGGGGWL